MNTRNVFAVSTFVSLFLSVTAGAQTQAPPLGLTRIPTPGGADSVVISGIDKSGNVYGYARVNGVFNAYEWVGGTSPGVYPRLPADQNNPAVGYSIGAVNAAGAAVGGADPTAARPSAGIFWDTSKHPSPVPGVLELFGVSDANVLTGIAQSATGGIAAYWSTPASQPTLLPFPTQIDCANPEANLCYSWSNGLSPNGKYIVGGANLEDFHSFVGILWAAGKQVSNYSDYNVSGVQVTNSGVVVGSRDTAFDSDNPPELHIRHAFRWEAGTLTDLGCLPGAPAGSTFESSAASINASGVIVGISQVAQFTNHAVMWVNGQIIDLNTSLGSQLPAGWHLDLAASINDAGQFIVRATNDDTGESAYYLAKPLIKTNTTITSNINPSTYGQGIHLVAKVSPDSGPVPTTGSVSWYDNGVLQGSARMTTIGTSSWEPSTWTGGVHNVTAVFPGSATLAGSTSPVFKQTVNAATTRTTVSASGNPAIHGQSVQFTATVVPTSGTIAGTVTFKSGTTVLGTGTLDGRTKQTHITTSFAKAGSYAITAIFTGSQNFAGSTSSMLILTVK